MADGDEIRLVIPLEGAHFKRGEIIPLEAQCAFRPSDPIGAGRWQAKEKNAPPTAWFDLGENTLIEMDEVNPFPMSSQDTAIVAEARAGDFPGDFYLRLQALDDAQTEVVYQSNAVLITVIHLRVPIETDAPVSHRNRRITGSTLSDEADEPDAEE